ncbi:MAG: hypothetical protein JXB49_15655 [Bacteroidales bacterium]|nr:hypothetical protein [Bacteroidales bacterium]
MILKSNHNTGENVTNCKTARQQNCKTDLSDFTFLMPLRIDSEQRKENADTVINFILDHFYTVFLVVEGDESRKYYPEFKTGNFRYDFVEDTKNYFHKTCYINRLIEMANTQFIAVWDADVIIPPEQIVESVIVLRKGETVMNIPYDRRALACDPVLSECFRKTKQVELLKKFLPALPLMYGYYSTGGAFLANRGQYLKSGGENKNFLGWGPEDFERVKRMEILHQTVHFADGPLFHLWHPRGRTSWYADKKTEIQNRRELVNTCRYGRR